MLKVWDLPTRIYHWVQALLFVFLCLSGFGILGSEHVHERLGVLLAATVLWRIGWGVIGSDTAKFNYFFPTKQKLACYFSGQQTIGHNPAGAIMVLTLISLLLVQVLTGLLLSEVLNVSSWLARTNVKLIQRVHELNALCLNVLVGIHIMAILIYRLLGQDLVTPMFTGLSKNVSEKANIAFSSNKKALLLLLIVIFTLVITSQILN